MSHMNATIYSKKMMGKEVAIIGAGISGLLACKSAIQKGFSPVIFEARNCIGGVWSNNAIETTKLQTPKNYYQFSDFVWSPPPADGDRNNNFPDHKQVMEYLYAYASHFNIISRIKFNSKVIAIDYCCTDQAAGGGRDQAMRSWELWSGTGQAFSPYGKWNVIVQDDDPSSSSPKVYKFDFVIVCIGMFSDLPNVPHFPMNKGPEVFNGKVLHSMDYAAMDSHQVTEFIKDKRVTVVGFQKSALDIAAQVATINGTRNPCTLLFKKVYWAVPEHLNELSFRNLNRFSEFMIHKPGEGFLLWLLAVLLSPLLGIFSRITENYLKRTYPLKKYSMVPGHRFLEQVRWCMLPVLPPKFYDRAKEGSLVLKKSKKFSFFQDGLRLLLVQDEHEEEDEDDDEILETDIVILATGYKSEQKLANIFKSADFQKCITESSAPFYRECIHPRIPQLGILGYSEHPSVLFTTEMRSKWLASFLAGEFQLPTIKEMEENVLRWENCDRRYYNYGGNNTAVVYKRSCVGVLSQIHCNDEICKDMNFNPWRKKNLFSELFSPYTPLDYAELH